MFFVNNIAEKLDVSIDDALTLNPEVIKTNKRIVFDDNRAKKIATARKQSEVADFFSNSDEVDSYLLNRLSAEELETLTPEQRKELATNLTVREQLGKALAQYAKSIGTEITTEMAQEATNIIAEETARKLGKIDATPLEQNVARVLQTGKATFGAMAFIGGVGTAAKCTSIMIKQGVSPKKAVEETAKMSAEEQSDFVNDNYDTLIETAKKSETELKKDDYIERTYTKFANANVEETESFAIAKLVGQFYDRYGKNNPEIFEKWFNKLEVEYNIPDTERNNLHQSAMHKDEKFASLKDFVQEVQTNYNAHLNEKKQIGNLKLSVPANVIQHDKKHTLRPDEWQEIEENIDNIFIAKKTDRKNSYSENNYNIGIKTPNGNYYALTIGINRHDNLVCTAMKNTKNGVEAYVEERGKKDKKKSLSMMPTSQPSAPVGNNTNSVASHSQDSNNIIAYIKEQLNPSEQENNILYQSVVTAGAKTSAEISDAQKEWQEKGTDSKYFKKWFGDSKVVDENGQPLVVYHGSPSHDITTFDSGKTLYGEVSKGFNFFTNKKSAYQNSAKDYAEFAGTDGYRRNGKVYETYLKIQKAKEVFSALQKIANGSEEETVKNLRNDLEEYGGTNDVTFVFGNNKKGIIHITKKHGIKTLFKVFDAVIDGEVLRYVSNKKTVIIKKNNIEATLSLDENGNKKTWLLSGWDTKISPDEEGQFSANPKSTQDSPTFSRAELGAELNNIISDLNSNLNPVTFKQESIEEKLIAGYSYQEVMQKAQDLYDKVKTVHSEEEEKYILAQAHILEDAFEISENPEKYSPAKINDVMLNAYYVMNNQQISNDYLDIDNKSQRTYSDLLLLHKEKKEKQVQEYNGYFTEGQTKNIITIMQNRNKSTALHELGHLFLNGLNEFAKVSEDAKKQLDEVNKWLGYSGGEYTNAQHEKFAKACEKYFYFV